MALYINIENVLNVIIVILLIEKKSEIEYNLWIEENRNLSIEKRRGDGQEI